MATKCLLPSFVPTSFNAWRGCVQWFCPQNPSNIRRSDGIRDVDELVLDPESRRHQLAEPPDTEGLGRIVAGGDEVHPALAGIRHGVLGRLAGEEGVESQRDRVVDLGG